MRDSAKRLDLLDDLRGVAIVGVLLCHLLSPIFGIAELPWKGWFPDFSSCPPAFLSFFPLSFGQAGVSIFFVVSGFCIHLSFQKQGKRWRDFFIRRFFRIYPAYVAAVIFFTLLPTVNNWQALFHSAGVWPRLLSHLLLVFNFHPSTFLAINGSFWSLAIEAQLYLLYPVLLALTAKFGWRRSLAALAGCELLIRGAFGYLMQSNGSVNGTGEYVSWLIGNSPLAYWFSWALGAYLADAYLNKQPMPFSKAPIRWWLALAIICYFIKPLYYFRFLLAAVVTAIWGGKFLSKPATEEKLRTFPRNVLSGLGLWSYSIYLLHQPLLFLYVNLNNQMVPESRHSALLAFVLLLATLMVIIPFSILWYRIFELPGIALGKYILQKTGNRHDASHGMAPSRGTVRAGLVHARYYLMICVLTGLIGGSFLVSARFVPRTPEENSNLAWVLATNREASKRNGALAVMLAEDACQRTHYQEARMMGTLAAAYAEAGRFDEAISTVKRAGELAAEKGETNLVLGSQEMLQLYLNHQPYRYPPIEPAQ